MKIRRVRFADLDDTEALKKLYTRLNSCNANPNLVDSAICDTQTAFNGEFRRVTLIGEELTEGEFKPQATASFFSPPKDSSELAYYSHEPGKLVLASRLNNFIEIGGLVSVPEAKGYSKILTSVRALFIRWMRQENIIPQEDLLVELLPEELHSNTFWNKIVLPGFTRTTYSALCNELKVSPDLLFSTLCNLNFAERNRIVHTYFPKEISTQDLAPSAFSSVAAPQALRALQRIYNLRRIGYFPIDGGQNWIDKADNGLLGEVETTLQTAPDAIFQSELDSCEQQQTQYALVYNPKSKYEIYYSPGIWSDQVAMIPQTTASCLGLINGSQVGYRAII